MIDLTISIDHLRVWDSNDGSRKRAAKEVAEDETEPPEIREKAKEWVAESAKIQKKNPTIKPKQKRQIVARQRMRDQIAKAQIMREKAEERARKRKQPPDPPHPPAMGGGDDGSHT